MDSDGRNELLHDIINEMLGRGGKNYFARTQPPFDIDKTNQHDSKAEFLAEQSAVKHAIQGAEHVLAFFAGDDDTDDENSKDRRRGYRKRIDAIARNLPPKRKMESALDVLDVVSVQFSLSISTFALLLDFKLFLESRLKELGDQEQEFWNVSNRPPNYFARTIALREMPTIGLSRDGGFPDTDYGRALERIFPVLNIKIRPRGPAEWTQSRRKGSCFQNPRGNRRTTNLPAVEFVAADSSILRTQGGASQELLEKLREILHSCANGAVAAENWQTRRLLYARSRRAERYPLIRRSAWPKRRIVRSHSSTG